MSKVVFDQTTQSFIGLSSKHREELLRQFPHINLDGELERMRQWLLRHPERRGTMRFIQGWLQRTPTKGHVPAATAPNELIDAYLEDLWTQCEHLLQRNNRSGART